MKKVFLFSLILCLSFQSFGQVQSCLLPYSQILTTIGAHQDANITSLKADVFIITAITAVGLMAYINKNLRVASLARGSLVGATLVSILALFDYLRLSKYLLAEKDYDLFSKILNPQSKEADGVLSQFTEELGLKPTSENKAMVLKLLTEGFMNGRFCPDQYPMTRYQIIELLKAKRI